LRPLSSVLHVRYHYLSIHEDLLSYDEYVKPQSHWAVLHGRLFHDANNSFPAPPYF
jgi:hypothetical protein